MLKRWKFPPLIKAHASSTNCTMGNLTCSRHATFLHIIYIKPLEIHILSKFYYSAPSVYRPRFIANLAHRQNSRLSRFPPLKIPRYTAKLSYRHPPQVFRHKSRKTNLNSTVSTTHNYLLTAVYWSEIKECQNWSSYTVIDLIVEGRNRWSVVLIRITTWTYCILDNYFVSLFQVFNMPYKCEKFWNLSLSYIPNRGWKIP